MLRFQSSFFFLDNFVLAKLATSRIRVVAFADAIWLPRKTTKQLNFNPGGLPKFSEITLQLILTHKHAANLYISCKEF